MDSHSVSLPRKAREKLPRSAQRMFRETLRRANEAAHSPKEAEGMAWEAVRRKYGPRPGMKLWVRHDWQRTARHRPGDTTAHSSSQRRLARVERARNASKGKTKKPVRRRTATVVGTSVSGKGPAKARTIGNQRTLGEGVRMRHGLPQRRPVGRRV